MLWITTKRIFRAGFLGFWRNGFVTLSAVLVMTVTLFVLASLVLTGVMLRGALSELKEKIGMNVEFTRTASQEDIFKLRDDVQAQPNVAAVTYLDREEALARFRERHQNDQTSLQALEEIGENPFGAMLTIQAADPTQYEAVARFVNEHPLVAGSPSILENINYYDDNWRVAIDRLTRINESGERLGPAILLLLAFITIAITFNTIRLVIYTSRDEIQVMRLVGADQMYVRAPFMVEGVLYGAVAGVITLLLLYPYTYWLGSATGNFFGSIDIFRYYIENFPMFFLMSIGTGVVLGSISSFLAVRRYLSV